MAYIMSPSHVNMALSNIFGGSGGGVGGNITTTAGTTDAMYINPHVGYDDHMSRVTRDMQEREIEMLRAFAQRNDQFYYTGPSTSGGAARANRSEKVKEAHQAAMDALKKSAKPVQTIERPKAEAHSKLLKDLGFSKLSEASESIVERAMKENMIGISGYKRITNKAFKETQQKIRSNSQAYEILV